MQAVGSPPGEHGFGRSAEGSEAPSVNDATQGHTLAAAGRRLLAAPLVCHDATARAATPSTPTPGPREAILGAHLGNRRPFPQAGPRRVRDIQSLLD